MPKSKATEEYVIRAKKIHGDRYDYSKTVYNGVIKHIIIICRNHGEYTIPPSLHVNGRGCVKCNRDKKIKILKEKFIEKATNIHNGKYSYEKVNYIHSTCKVIITCPEHGDFLQLPGAHINGSECKKCAYEKINRYSKVGKKTNTTEQFIEKAKKIHSDKYNYDKVVYVYSTQPVIITCPKHGDFTQTPNRHLLGNNCYKCGIDIIRSNTDDFISKAIKKHGYKYLYTKVDYKYSNQKVIITCPTHGDFTQKPNSHLTGQGCPNCLESKNEKIFSNILKKLGIKNIREFKFPNQKSRHEYDFYLPVQDILVEIHGNHHYNPIEHFGGIERLKYTQECDKYKEHLAFKNHKPLIIYNHKLFKKPIEKLENLIITSLTLAKKERKSLYKY